MLIHVLAGARRRLRQILERLRVGAFSLRGAHPVPATRFAYQRNYIRHAFQRGELVLDVGSGGDPFPEATILADRYLQPTHHRSAAFAAHGKPVVICDVDALPFQSAQFAYVVCSHVLEHVDDPIAACRELQRIAEAGFIETPTLMKDALFAWAKGMHRWYVVTIANHVLFVEYDERRLQGIGSDEWYRMIFGPSYHPLQAAFNGNQDLFNNLFEWKHRFEVSVYRLDGRVNHLHLDDLRSGIPERSVAS